MLYSKGCNKTISTIGAEVQIETNKSQTSNVKGCVSMCFGEKLLLSLSY